MRWSNRSLRRAKHAEHNHKNDTRPSITAWVGGCADRTPARISTTSAPPAQSRAISPTVQAGRSTTTLPGAVSGCTSRARH